MSKRIPNRTKEEQNSTIEEVEDSFIEEHCDQDRQTQTPMRAETLSTSKQTAARKPQSKRQGLTSSQSSNQSFQLGQTSFSTGNHQQSNPQGKSTRKRVLAQRTQDEGNRSPLDTGGRQAINSTLWIEKYAPKTMQELAINKKKVEEFAQIAESPGILVLNGAPGSGKNALLHAYASQRGYKLIRYRDTNTLHDEELYGGRREVFGGRAYYPREAENLLAFIRKYSHVASQRKPIGASSFCRTGLGEHGAFVRQSPRSFEPTKSQESATHTELQICLIQGLPECLKVVSSVRAQLLSDFNQALLTFQRAVDQAAQASARRHPLLVFTFSEASERHQSFQNRIFQQVVQAHKSFSVLSLNPPTDKSIDQVLKQIATSEGLSKQSFGDQYLVEIRMQCSRDLRNAILTLQFKAAGKTLGQLQASGKSSSKRLLPETKRKDQGSGQESHHGKVAKANQGSTEFEQPTTHGKDLQLQLFHALGKFLYNKRIHPQTGNVEQLPYELMKDPETRPKMYFRPREVLDKSLIEPSMFSLYLHQNIPQFFGDIDDLADCLDNFSHQDDVRASTTYQYGNMQEIFEMQQLSGLICSQSVTETNLHCAEAMRQGNGGKYGHSLTTMQKPDYFDHLQQLRTNRLALSECLKESQLVTGELFSEDLLIRSQREALCNIVPFLQQMPLAPEFSHRLQELKLTSRPREHLGQTLTQEEAVAQNFEQEQRFQTHQARQARVRAKQGQKLQAIRFQADQNSAAKIFRQPLQAHAQAPQQYTEMEEGNDEDSDIDPDDLADYVHLSDSDDIDMDALVDAVEDLSMEPIEDEVDLAVINRYTHDH